MSWTRILRFRNGNIINGRLVQVETKQACYYRYIIHETDTANWMPDSKRIVSEWKYTNAMGAFSAGKAAA